VRLGSYCESNPLWLLCIHTSVCNGTATRRGEVGLWLPECVPRAAFRYFAVCPRASDGACPRGRGRADRLPAARLRPVAGVK